MSQPTAPANRAQRIEHTVRTALDPTLVEVIDESARHAGHAGARQGGETHYNLTIVSRNFYGLSRIARTRIVNDLLAGEFDLGLHALSLVLRTPEESLS